MKQKQYVLALITAEEDSARIINSAKIYAEKLEADLQVLTVQPKKADAKMRSRDMIILTTLSKKTSSEINIVYSDKPFEAIVRHTKKSYPLHIFVGQEMKDSDFINMLRLAELPIPISFVGIDNIIYTFPFIISSNDLKLG